MDWDRCELASRHEDAVADAARLARQWHTPYVVVPYQSTGIWLARPKAA